MQSAGEGKFRVRVEKNHPFLGIAIEGGKDTKQKEARIISISVSIDIEISG